MQRFRRAIEAAAHSYGVAPPETLAGGMPLLVGDLTGTVTPSDVLGTRDAAFWHLAASGDPHPSSSNRALLESALRLAHEMECRCFVTVDGAGGTPDDETASACRQSRMPSLVLRIPNLLGSSTTCRLGGNHRGVFALAAQDPPRRAIDPKRLYAFAHVDHVVQDMLACRAPDEGVTVRTVPGAVAWPAATIQDALSVVDGSAPHVGATGPDGPTLQAMADDATPALPTGRPRISPVDLRANLLAWRSESRGDAPWVPAYVSGRNGSRITAYEYAPASARRPVAVIVNAYGVLPEALTLLAETLSERLRVVTWATRGLPDLTQAFDPEACALRAQSNDLAAVLDFYGAPRAHVAGWCTGGMVAAQFALAYPQRTLSLSLLNASIPRWQDAMTLAQQAAAKTYAALSRGRQYATAGFQIVHSPSNETDEFAELDQAQQRFARGPSRHPEALYRYACLGTRYFADVASLALREIRVPALVIAATGDQLAGTLAAKRAATMIRSSEYREVVGEHFDLCSSPGIAQDVKAFMCVVGSAPEDVAAATVR